MTSPFATGRVGEDQPLPRPLRLQWGELRNRRGTKVQAAFIQTDAPRAGRILSLTVAPGRGGWKQWFVSNGAGLITSGRTRSTEDGQRAAEAEAERLLRAALAQLTGGAT